MMTREERIEQKKEKMQEKVDTYGTEMYETLPRKIGAFFLEVIVFLVADTILEIIFAYIIKFLCYIKFINTILSISWIYYVVVFIASISYGQFAVSIVQGIFKSTINQAKAYLPAGIFIIVYGIVSLLLYIFYLNKFLPDVSMIV